jgi:zinc/manganese transport system permease protein
MQNDSIFFIMLPAFCECLVLVGIHSYLGIHVIKRKVIFVDLAFAQIAALGTLVAFLFGIPPHTIAAFVFALSFTAMGAAIFSLCRFRRSRVPQEAIIGLVYAIAAATAILLIDKAPHGAEHLKEILTGSILWVKWGSILTAAIVYSCVGAFHYVFRKRFLLISEDPEKAWESGLNVRMWDFLFYLSFGLVITLSVDVAGVLIVFVFLVAPAILAMVVSDRLKTQLILGWGLGVAVTTAGLLLAYVKDLSTGPAVIATYGITMILFSGVLYILRSPRRSRAVLNSMLVICAFAVALGVIFLGGSWIGDRVSGSQTQGYEEETVSPEDESEWMGPEALVQHMKRMQSVECGIRELARIDDLTERTEAVIRVLDLDGPVGARLALEYMDEESLPFFREQIANKLAEIMRAKPGFAVDEDFGSATNQRAAERVRRHFGLTSAGFW